MPHYLVYLELWKALWPAPLAATLITALLLFVHRPRISRRQLFVVLLSFALLGMVTGLLAGFSRTPAMGAVLPAILSLVGGLAIYLVGAEKADQALIGTCVIALSLDLLIGSTWGAVLRNDFDKEAESVDSRKIAAVDEVEVRDFRTDLGLPAIPPPPPIKKDSE